MPADGSLPDAALAEFGVPAVRALRPRPVLHGALRLLRLQHLHRRGARGRSRGVASRRTPKPSIHEIRHARRVLGDRDVPIDTIFFGGGTPTLLKPADLGAVVASAAAEFGLSHDIEITTEANPDSVTAWDLEELRSAGFNRISFGMQSAVDHVLKVLDRTHDPLRVPAAVEWARTAGFDEVSARPDLRHAGGVGRRLGDLAGRGARLRARPRVGVLADRRGRHRPGPAGASRRAADARRGRPRRQVRPRRRAAHRCRDSSGTRSPTGRAGPSSRCRHNVLYWTGGHWWGVGPGAHSHVGGVRWWNVKHPAAYADRLAARRSARPWPTSSSARTTVASSGSCSRSGFATACPCWRWTGNRPRPGRPAGRGGAGHARDRAADPDPPRTAPRRRGRARPDVRRWLSSERQRACRNQGPTTELS